MAQTGPDRPRPHEPLRPARETAPRRPASARRNGARAGVGIDALQHPLGAYVAHAQKHPAHHAAAARPRPQAPSVFMCRGRRFRLVETLLRCSPHLRSLRCHPCERPPRHPKGLSTHRRAGGQPVCVLLERDSHQRLLHTTSDRCAPAVQSHSVNCAHPPRMEPRQLGQVFEGLSALHRCDQPNREEPSWKVLRVRRRSGYVPCPRGLLECDRVWHGWSQPDAL